MSGERFVRLNGCTIEAIPSVHYRVPFAQEVNAACGDPARTPDAIAVELPESAVAAVCAWLRDLREGPGAATQLPCMLALIGPGAADAAPTDDEDGAPQPARAATMEWLPLSPVDSIVEAIRCGLELGVPVAGVDPHLDAEEFAPAGTPLTWPDPLEALDGLGRFTAVTARFLDGRGCDAHRYRERVMAARLRRLADAHDRVLFVCGLAHWGRIRALLAEGDDGGGDLAPDRVGPALTRAVVHPSIAIAAMDAAPAVVAAFERARVPAHVRAPRPRLDLAAVQDILAAQVRDAYAERFHDGPLDRAGIADFAAVPGFEHMLANGALLRQHRAATARDLLVAAHVATSPAFERAAARVVLRYPFVTAKDPRFRGLPRLMPTGRPGAGMPRMALVAADGRRGPAFALPDGAIASTALERESLPQWLPPAQPGDALEPGVLLDWPPIDRMVDVLCVQALALGRRHAAAPRVEAFAGSLEDGLDIRATTRSHARGAETAFVRTTPYRARRQQRAARAWEPVVFLHDLVARPGDRLRALAEPFDELLPYARDPARMRDAQRRGSIVVEQVAFGAMTGGYGRGRVPGGVATYVWRGIVVFSPCHFTWTGTARFLEETDYQINPLASYPMPTSTSGQTLTPRHAVVRMFAEQHGMHLNLDDWTGVLIRLAIPYARSVLTVVAPDGYAVAPAILAEAAGRGIDVHVLPRSVFSPDLLQKVACWHAVQPLGGTDCKRYPEETEREFGERAVAHDALLPAWMRLYESGAAG
jgi:hypothetical protein